jgi:hypothetical protein
MKKTVQTLLVSCIAAIAWSQPAQQPKNGASPEPRVNAPQAATSQNPTRMTSAQTGSESGSQSGEARRNENVKVDLVDTNAARESNLRVGAAATIVDEFKANLRYFGAEYGQQPNAPIHAVAEKGSGFHGGLEWRHSNSVFAARSFFQVGSVQPARQNTFRENLSLPVWTGSFLSVTASQDRNRGAVNGNILIPLPSERTPLTTDPATRAVVQRILDAYPAAVPNRPDIAERAYNTNSPQSSNSDNYGARLDQGLSARDKLLLRYSFTAQRIEAFQFVKGQNSNTDAKSHTARITWSRSRERGGWEISAGFDRQYTALTADKQAVFPIKAGGAVTSLGPSSNIPLNRTQNSFHSAAGLYGVTTRHSWTAGFRGTRFQYNGQECEQRYPSFSFRDEVGRTAMENLLLGNVTSMRFAVGTEYRAFRNWDGLLYAGDHWSATKDLSVSLALRYEPWFKPNDKTGQSKMPFGSDLNNVGGSLGLAYRLPGNWGVARAASTVQYGQIFPVTYGQDRLNPPYHIAVMVLSPELANYQAYMNQPVNPNTRSTIVTLSPELTTPYSVQYNASWETEIARGWRLQAGYVGSRSHKLFLSYGMNRAQYVEGIPFTAATLNQRRPNQDIYDNWLIANGSKSWYDAGRISITAPQWHQLSLTAAYWMSKSLDLGGDYTLTGAALDSHLAVSQTESEFQHDMKARSTFDQPHAFSAQVAYKIPRLPWAGKAGRAFEGWTISIVELLKPGTPFSLDSGSDSLGFGNNDGTPVDRPMLLDASVLGRTIGNPDTSRSLLPRSAFRFIDAPSEMAGNLGRNTFRKGAIANTNASISKSWRVGNGRMRLGAESVNLLNTPQFAGPDYYLISTNFGRITNTLNDGRTFRFSFRTEF